MDIPFEFEMVGHSDADVLLHAVTDAVLGAAAQGDIGELFPNTDESNRDRDSADFLLAAVSKVQAAGFRVVNLDCIVFAERPKLSQYKVPIAENLAKMLQVAASTVNVKAKTGEAVGPVGRGEAIMAECIVMLESTSD